MEDTLTIIANLSTAGFAKGTKEMTNAIRSLSRTAKQFGRSMITTVAGVGSAVGILTKAISTYMSQNEQLSQRMSAIWTALGNVLGPIIKQIVDWISTAVSYFLSFLKLLGVTGKSASELSKAAKKNTQELQKTLLGFDELNVLQDNSQQQDNSNPLQNKEPAQWMKDLVDMIKNGEWAKLAQFASDALINALNKLADAIASVDWQKIGAAIREFFLNIKYEEIADAIFHLLKTAWEAALDLLWGLLAGDSEEEPPIVKSLRKLGDAVEELYVSVKEVIKIIWNDYLKPFVDWLIEIGLPAVIDKITAAVQKLAEYMKTHGDTVAQIVVGLLDVIVAYQIGKKILNLIGIVKTLFTVIAANPIALLIGLLVLLAAKFIAAYQTNEEFREKVNAAWEKIKGVVEKVIDFVKRAQDFFDEFFAKVDEAIWGFVDSVKEKIEQVKEVFEGLKEKFGSVRDNVGEVCTSIKDAWTDTDSTLVEKLLNIGQIAFDTFSQMHATITEKVVGIIDTVIPGFADVHNQVTGYMNNIAATAFSAFTETASFTKTSFQEMFQSISETWNNSDLTTFEKVTSIWNIVTEKFSSIRDHIKERMIEIIDAVIPGFSDLYEQATQKVQELKDKITEKLSSLPQDALTWGQDLVRSFIDGINSWFNNLVNSVRGIADTIWSYLHFSEPEKGPLADFSTYGPDMIKELAGGITRSKGLVEKAVSDIADTVAFQMPAVAGGSVVPYSVSASSSTSGGSADISTMMERFMSALDTFEDSIQNMQLVAQFGSFRVIAEAVEKEMRRKARSEGR